jgi:hypothetical protein
MYAILVSIALAMYALILTDFSLLFHEISVNADIVTSTQALYTAEGVIESTFNVINEADASRRNIKFLLEKGITPNERNESYLPYNEESDSFYIKRSMSLSGPDLNAAEAFDPNNRVVKSGAFLVDGQTLDKTAFYGLEPLKARGFVLRETDTDGNFNEISFEYNQNGENSDLLFEIFAFPREGGEITFLDFESLKAGYESSVKRIVINTRDSSQNGMSYITNDQPLTVHFGGYSGNYGNQIRISGFQPLNSNYIIHFQTLDNNPVHFKLAAFYQNQPVMLPDMMQTIDVIGVTPTALYQRVKMQRQTEEGILPGLNFVHFSDGPINK